MWILAACLLFLRREGSIHCVVTALRRHSSDLLQGVSCTLSFRREAKDIKNIRKLFTLIHEKQQPEVIKKRKFKSNPLRDNHGYDCIELMMADSDIITLGSLLADKQINFAQAPLQKQHRELTRLLQLTFLLPKHTKAPLSLQIVHSQGIIGLSSQL